MEYTIILIVAFLFTTWAISEVQLDSILLLLIDRLVSVFGLRSACLKLTRIAIGTETLTHVLSSVRLLAGDDFHFNIHRAPTQLDLLLVVLFLVSSGSMCYLNVLIQDDDTGIAKPAANILDDFFESVSTRSQLPKYISYSFTPLMVEDSLWDSPAQWTNPHDGIFEYPLTSTPARKRAPVIPAPACSTRNISTDFCVSWLSAGVLRCTTRLSSAIRSWTVASNEARCLSAISSVTSKAAPLSSLATYCSLSDDSAADLDLTLVDDADESCDVEAEESRRVFGIIVPAERWQPKTFTLADLEIDDGSYLRDALGLSHFESLEGCFWPELNEFVEPRADGKREIWYTDADEMRGWIFPGREDVPDSPFEPTDDSESWDCRNVFVFASVSEMVRVV
ncbi:hypothetical protein C8T65DRAFT_728099 [Cerioporus squamosus]|nr:hypothetical protein C8T65DRAFT_728099 [Cerioporus squamosus]